MCLSQHMAIHFDMHVSYKCYEAWPLTARRQRACYEMHIAMSEWSHTHSVGGRTSAREIYQKYTRHIPNQLNSKYNKQFYVYQSVLIEPE